jgi:hypothetical protein
MFQYFSETIINDAKAIHVESKKDAQGNVTDPKAALIIEGVGLYMKNGGEIHKIYKRAYRAEAKEKLVKDLDANAVLKAGDVVRFKVGTFQQGLVTSIYGDTQIKHVKPFFVEVTVKDATKVAEEIAAVMKKQLNLSDFKFFTIEGNGTEITLEGADCYTKFAVVELVKIKDTARYEEFLPYEEIYTWDGKYDTAAGDVLADEGSGTVTRLIKNLRVPTETNHAPFAPDFGGRPIPGKKYDQYVIETITERREMGVGVVGANAESFTKQIIFTSNDGVSQALEAGLADIDIDMTAGSKIFEEVK